MEDACDVNGETNGNGEVGRWVGGRQPRGDAACVPGEGV